METRPLPEPQEPGAFPPIAIIIFCAAGLVLLLFFVIGLWYLFGFIPAFWCLLSCSVLAGLGFGFTRWEHHHHDIKDRVHMRELTREALANHHSIEYNPHTRTLRTISPLTIPDGPLTIKQTNTGMPALPPGEVQYPLAPPFASMKSLIRPGRLVLGYGMQGPITGDVSDLLSMAFVGKPGTGKSTGLLYYLAILLLIDASVYVFDPQGSLYEVSGLIPYYGEYDEIYNAIPAIYEELEEREDLWRHTKQVKQPLLVLVDELPAIARYEEKMKPAASVLDLAEKIVTQNRKHNCFCMLTGQSLPAQVLPTLTRDNLSSRLVFNSSDMHARMAGLDEESRKKLLPLLRKAQPGTAILDVSRRPQPDIAALPFTTIDDLRAIIDDDSVPNGPAVPEAFPAWEAVPDSQDRGTGTLGTPFLNISQQEREQIVRLAREGVPRREMCLALGKGKQYYPLIRQVLDEAGL